MNLHARTHTHTHTRTHTHKTRTLSYFCYLEITNLLSLALKGFRRNNTEIEISKLRQHQLDAFIHTWEN